MMLLCRSESDLTFGIKILNRGCYIKVLESFVVENVSFFKYFFMKIFGFLIREFDFFLCQNEALLVLNLNLFSKVYVTFLYRQGDHLKLGHFFEIFFTKMVILG